MNSSFLCEQCQNDKKWIVPGVQRANTHDFKNWSGERCETLLRAGLHHLPEGSSSCIDDDDGGKHKLVIVLMET